MKKSTVGIKKMSTALWDYTTKKVGTSEKNRLKRQSRSQKRARRPSRVSWLSCFSTFNLHLRVYRLLAALACRDSDEERDGQNPTERKRER